MNALRMIKNKITVWAFVWSALLVPLPQEPLPPGPAEALRTLGAWVLDLGMAGLAVYFAIKATQTGKKTQDVVSEDQLTDKPVGESLKKWGKWVLVIGILLSTTIIPQLIFDQRGPIGGILSFVISWILDSIGVAAG